MLASCSGDKTVRIWTENAKSNSWECSAILEETHHRTIRGCSWSPDGRCLATASFDATTAIWVRQVKTAESFCSRQALLCMYSLQILIFNRTSIVSRRCHHMTTVPSAPKSFFMSWASRRGKIMGSKNWGPLLIYQTAPQRRQRETEFLLL